MLWFQCFQMGKRTRIDTLLSDGLFLPPGKRVSFIRFYVFMPTFPWLIQQMPQKYFKKLFQNILKYVKIFDISHSYWMLFSLKFMFK